MARLAGSQSRVKILHTCEFYPPSIGGAQEVVRRLSELLARSGHDVTVATTRIAEREEPTREGVKIEEFSISGDAVRGMTGEVTRYQEMLVDGGFDVIMNYAAQQWATDAAFPVLHEIGAAKVLAPCGFSGLNQAAYTEYFRRLPAILTGYERLVVHSDRYQDAEFIRRAGFGNLVVIPNGAGADEFADSHQGSFRGSLGIADDMPLLITVGNHTGLKGHREALTAFLRARIGRAVLVIIGNSVDNGGCIGECQSLATLARVVSGGKKSVILMSPSRQGVVSALREADLFVFASRIECSPLVLFEAAAAGTAFVTSSVGNAVEIAEWTSGGVVVDGARDSRGYVRVNTRAMAHEIERLVHDRDERLRLGAAGRLAWRERFTWELVASRYEDLYRSLVPNAYPA